MSTCPLCDFKNLEGADLCEQCEQPLSDLSRRTPETAVERGLIKDRIDAFFLNLMKLPAETRNTKPGISGRFTIAYYHRPIDIRYERHRTYRGYHLTMRLLDKSHINVKLGKGSLAFDDETLFELSRVMKIPAGIIVMSGPTGSGKSTTLNAMLRELNRPEVNILTLEKTRSVITVARRVYREWRQREDIVLKITSLAGQVPTAFA